MIGDEVLKVPIRSARTRVRVAILVLILIAIGLGTIASLRFVAKHSTTVRVPLSPTPQGGTVIGITSANQVPKAVLNFLPLGASDTIQMAIRHATGNLKSFPARYQIQHLADHQYQVTISIPVNLKVLERGGEIIRGGAPGASSLKAGDLYVAGNMHGYAVHMNPKTDLAQFKFYLAPNDRTIWAVNWNALGIISQNDSLN